MKKIVGLCLASWLTFAAPQAAFARGEPVQLQAGHPEEYVVVKGDTLWDISGRFLTKPWRWPEVWDINPQIDNPHLIYPGDIIYLTWVNGEPKLRLKSADNGIYPRARVSKLDPAINAIPLKDLHAFMSDNVVLDEELLKDTPYVLGGRNERIISGAGDRIYARGVMDSEQRMQSIYRPAKEYKDPETDELLGYELNKVGEGQVVGIQGDIITLELDKTKEEVRVLDRVIPAPEGRIQSMFYPAPAPEESKGFILSVLRGVSKIGRYDAVAISQGERDGVQPGHVYQIFSKGESIKDPITEQTVQLPSEEAGTLMVFKSYEKVSYALIMTATNVISIGDQIRAAD